MSDPDDSGGGNARPGPADAGETVPRDGPTGEPSANAGTDADETAIESILEAEELGESRRLDPKVRVQWVIGSLFGAVVGGVFTTVAVQFLAGTFGLYDVDGSLPLGFARLSVYLGALAVLVFVLLAVARAVLYYRSWRYEVRSDSLYLTRGVFTKIQTVAPYIRVQHIDTRRSPVERTLGLSSLVVYTAGSRGADVTIPGLTDERAAELQARLKRLAIASEEEDAV